MEKQLYWLMGEIARHAGPLAITKCDLRCPSQLSSASTRLARSTSSAGAVTRPPVWARARSPDARTSRVCVSKAASVGGGAAEGDAGVGSGNVLGGGATAGLATALPDAGADGVSVTGGATLPAETGARVGAEADGVAVTRATA